ncbi:MAG: manganese efflux pump [candidate division Zixibacteria bacterium]|nr:manganese efflux pump [candidate division Zixibacteria bacterium]
MAFIEIILISIGLGFDAFSVALTCGAQGFTWRRVFRLGWHFGLFQFMMPIIGWFLGEFLSQWIGSYGSWIVLLLLLLIGGKMFYEGIKDKPDKLPDLSKGWILLMLSFATSLDALGVGVGFGLLDISIIKPAIIIGVVCSVMTAIGLYLGVMLYDRLGHRALILGGLILMAIGIRIIC